MSISGSRIRKSGCAECLPPVSVYPAAEIVNDKDWGRIEKLQQLIEDPFECPSCNRDRPYLE
jgi:hypothetical protein